MTLIMNNSRQTKTQQDHPCLLSGNILRKNPICPVHYFPLKQRVLYMLGQSRSQLILSVHKFPLSIIQQIQMKKSIPSVSSLANSFIIRSHCQATSTCQTAPNLRSVSTKTKHTPMMQPCLRIQDEYPHMLVFYRGIGICFQRMLPLAPLAGPAAQPSLV